MVFRPLFVGRRAGVHNEPRPPSGGVAPQISPVDAKARACQKRKAWRDKDLAGRHDGCASGLTRRDRPDRSSIGEASGQQQLASQLNGVLNGYVQHVSHQGLMDFADTVRSHLGVNLTQMPLSVLTRIETDPQVVALYRRMLHKDWGYLRDDHNAVVDLIHTGFAQQAGPNDVAHALEALRNYPVDLSQREFDHSAQLGLVVSPWPDRFGRVGGHALVPHHFPIHERGPDIFPWRGHPRAIKSGSNDPDVKVAPLGYLVPYWMARELGVIGPGD